MSMLDVNVTQWKRRITESLMANTKAFDEDLYWHKYKYVRGT